MVKDPSVQKPNRLDQVRHVVEFISSGLILWCKLSRCNDVVQKLAFDFFGFLKQVVRRNLLESISPQYDSRRRSRHELSLEQLEVRNMLTGDAGDNVPTDWNQYLPEGFGGGDIVVWNEMKGGEELVALPDRLQAALPQNGYATCEYKQTAFFS